MSALMADAAFSAFGVRIVNQKYLSAGSNTQLNAYFSNLVSYKTNNESDDKLADKGSGS